MLHNCIQLQIPFMSERHIWGVTFWFPPSPLSCLVLHWSVGGLSAGLWERGGKFQSLTLVSAIGLGNFTHRRGTCVRDHLTEASADSVQLPFEGLPNT